MYMHTMTNELDMSAIENCACFNLRSVSRTVTRFFDAEVRHHGVRPTQTPILGALQAKEGWGMTELSEWLGMERTTLVRNLRPLEREGLVQANGGGRGGHVELRITEKGRKMLAKTLPAWRTAQDRVAEILGGERWTNIIRDLDQLATELKKR